MAIHILPNGAEWDDTLDFEDQTESAQEFWQTLQENVTPVDVTEPSINPNMPRLVSKTWTDTSYETYDYQIIQIRHYQNSAMDKKAFAVKSVEVIYNINNK
jgi:UDP-N-acetyl-D-mannosaminuronate dehydrogenase